MLKFFTKIRILLWILILVGVGFLVSTQVKMKLSQAEANLKSLETTEIETYPVETEILKTSDWETWRSYYGQAKSAHTQNITTFEREIVKSVNVNVGSYVKAGQTLVTLQVAARGAQLQSGKTAYDEAKLNYNRLKQLNAKGGISQSEVDSAYARMKTAEANLRSSQSTLQRTSLKASIDGIVSARNVEPGEIAEAGAVLISIVDPKEMEAELMVSKKDIMKINKSTPVEIYVDGQKHIGWVKRLSPEAQSGSGLYPVVVGLPENSGILPGTYVEGRFMVNRQQNVVVIPSNVVVYRGNTQSVYVAKDNTAKLTAITTGEGREGKVIATSGLKPGDYLITSGNRVLYDGAQIIRNLANHQDNNENEG
ncbi:MAG: efflux RND transporter periplasmic adaptor subunit [Synergistaceae bacterium]|nr:efflux RND transporter periplasmic adaptor subunit [Synergistaceae bacterium]MBQ6737718.1 efflux RND transporter periplasmic adaptor subunit [Synergistaceae bacterium]MBR0075280.1 efflux RND transporter periplasmic adaptor subunit [Synergistaceae bacterium]MBR0080334.1 efflux RND transporter periplasmic adaptor subunit [Synergistaceae bacterium]MBR0234334.1 efflux RND transporter periplasmic adaptor subunit [Synergistaceae bacterium]